MQNATITAVMVLAASGSAMAADPNFDYTYLEAGYQAHDFDGEDGNGYQLEGSFGFSSNFFIVATAAEAETDVNVFISNWGDTTFGTNVEYDLDYEISRNDFALGLGGAWPLGKHVDIVVRAVYAESELTENLNGGNEIITYLRTDDPPLIQSVCALGLCGTTSIDDQGFATSAGLRGKASERIEVYGDLTYYNVNLESELVNMNGDNLALKLGTRVTLTRNLLLSLGYARQGDIESLQAALRLAL